MKTKVLVVPTLIVVSGFVALMYLKPDYDTYMEKRAVRDAMKESALQAEATANNIRSLRTEIDGQQANVEFVKRYLPAEKDHGRIFDSLNFLTGQAGLLTSNIKVSEVAESENQGTFGVVDPLTDADPLATVDDGATVSSVPVAPPYQAPVIKRYGVSLEAIGGYSNVKDLLIRLSNMDRMQEFTSFKISSETEVAAEGEVAPASGGTLTLAYDATMLYQLAPAPLMGSALVSVPGFSQSTFDFATIDTIRSAATIVPTMVLGTDGKANPFE